MARKREISPGIWENEEFVEMSVAARLTWIGLWSVCDRHGCFEWRPRKWTLKFAVGIPCKGEEVFQELLDAGFVERYEAEGEAYGFVVKWTKHQDPHPREKAVYPTPTSPNYVHTRASGKPEASHRPATGQQPASNLPASGFSPKATGQPPASRWPATSLPPKPSFPSCPSVPSKKNPPSPTPSSTQGAPGGSGEGQGPPLEESRHLGEVLRVCPPEKRGDPVATRRAWAVVLAQGEATELELRDCVKAEIQSFLPQGGREDRVQWLTRLDLLLLRGNWKPRLPAVRAAHHEDREFVARVGREPPEWDDEGSPEPILLEPLTRGA